MLLDIRQLETTATLRAQVCIVGGGAAGIALARRLSSKGIESVLLESGGLSYDPSIQALYAGEVRGAAYAPLESVRLRYLGGTTNHWAGQSVPLDRLDFQVRGWVPDSGWPIPYDEYYRYVDEARSVCEVSDGSFNYERAVETKGSPPFPQLPGFEPVLFRYSNPPTRFGARYGQDLANDANIRCCLQATCLRLVPDRDGQRIAWAEVRSLTGRSLRVVADDFVVAIGAIENSRLLLLSRRPSGGALGNEYGLVGRFFMEHPFITLDNVVLTRQARAAFLRTASFRGSGKLLRRDVRLTRKVQAHEQILNHSVYLSDARTQAPASFGERIVKLWDRVGAEIFSEIDDQQSNQFICCIRLEHAPYMASRVALADTTDSLGLPRTRLDLHFGELEKRTILRVWKRLASALGETSLGRMRVDPEEWLDRYVERLGWQNHHLGGTRMHSSPRQGVVDTNCLVHGTANLFVAGASVFPTSGHANPTMNLVALTLRLGDYLAARNGARKWGKK